MRSRHTTLNTNKIIFLLGYAVLFAVLMLVALLAGSLPMLT